MSRSISRRPAWRPPRTWIVVVAVILIAYTVTSTAAHLRLDPAAFANVLGALVVLVLTEKSRRRRRA